MRLEEILNYTACNAHTAFFFTPPFYKKSKSFLFTDPDIILTAKNSEEVAKLFLEVQDFINRGYSGYAALSYELGYLFEPRLQSLFPKVNNTDLMLVYLFKPGKVKLIDSKSIDYSACNLKDQQYNISDFRLNVNKGEYLNSIKRIKNYIAEGDTYQINYTIKAKFKFDGEITGIFLQGINNQSARYSALLNTGNKYIISFSPELFFSVNNRKLLVVPMKGTMARGNNIQNDRNQYQKLFNSKKDKAENLMITDLLRNDVGRISSFGSVKLVKLFHIEKYETVYQMVSIIASKLLENFALKDVIVNLFPGGSVTGAPKIRSMEIIRELEKEPRGIYTGALGFFSKNDFVFNIPIRTLIIDKKTGKGEMGIGSGIVWDSIPEKELEESLLKSRFLFNTDSDFGIFETMLIEHGEIFLLALHLKRMKRAADYFLFRFSRKKLIAKLSEICTELDKSKKYRLKLSLNKWGIISTLLNELEENTNAFKVVVSDKRIDSTQKYYYFKTTQRALYSEELKKYGELGFNEVIFLNENNELCEGSFTNVFIKKNNIWFTPPIHCGLLNGTYREMLLEKKKLYKEKLLYPDDLQSADEIMLVNSLRKEIPVESIYFPNQSNNS